MAKKNPSVLWTVDQSGENGIGDAGRLNAQQNIGIKGDFVKAAATDNQFVTHVTRKTDKTLVIHTAQPSLSNLSGLGGGQKNRSIVTNNTGAIISQELKATEDDQTSSATTIKVVSSMTEDGQGNVTFTTKNITTATLNDPGITTLLTNTYASNTRVTTENTAVTAKGVWTAINSLFSSGLTDPSSAPGYAGLTYQNSSSKDIWFSTGTTDVKDWNLISNRVHQLIVTTKSITISHSTSARNILCDKQNYEFIEHGGVVPYTKYEFEPVTPEQLYTWINRGDSIIIDGADENVPWGDYNPVVIVEAQLDPATHRISTMEVVGHPHTNSLPWSYYHGNCITDDDNVTYFEFTSWGSSTNYFIQVPPKISRKPLNGTYSNVTELNFEHVATDNAKILSGATTMGNTVPTPASYDVGKVPVVKYSSTDSRGYYILEKYKDDRFPDSTSSNIGQVLSVDEHGVAVWDAHHRLPIIKENIAFTNTSTDPDTLIKTWTSPTIISPTSEVARLQFTVWVSGNSMTPSDTWDLKNNGSKYMSGIFGQFLSYVCTVPETGLVFTAYTPNVVQYVYISYVMYQDWN